jgi:hypothetical protein
MMLDVEAERRIQRQRGRVVGVLQQPDASRVAGVLEHRLHEASPDAAPLCVGRDRDRPDAADRTALVDEVRAGDLTVDLGHHTEERGVADPALDEPTGELHCRVIQREAALLGDLPERLERDAPTRLRVLGGRRSKMDSGHGAGA